MMELPRQLTPFIGRHRELADLSARLCDADCRLLSIIGAGGVGKTRLALQAAKHAASHFADGVHFLPLQTLDASQSLAAALAGAMQITQTGQVAVKDQLFAYLQEKELLLVLDNFEHLLSQVTLLSEMLQATAQVKLLVTSREVLSLQEEWIYRLGGMQTPQPDSQDDVATYDAVQFFTARLHRVHSQAVRDEDQAAIVRICQMVEGVPLALELAASWAGTMSCSAIAGEIQQNIGFLASGLRNLPDRHRSMRAVFEQSWQRLTPEEQAAFCQLAVFRGTFRRQAAEAIAATNLSTLSALVNKSLLQWDEQGRYHLHELLRQFAEEQLMASPAGSDVRDRHCAYYAGFLQQRLDDIHSGRQMEAMHAVAAELDNVRAAWDWAAMHGKVREIRRAVHALAWFWHYQSRYQEAANALQRAIPALEMATPAGEQGVALAEVLVQLGWLWIRLGRLEQAAAVLTRGQAIYGMVGLPPIADGGSDPLSALAMVTLLRGDAAQALNLLEEARTQQEARGDGRNLATTYYVLTAVHVTQGRYALAEVCAQQAHRLALAAHDQWSLAYIHNDMGQIAYLLGQRQKNKWQEAKQHYRTSYAIRRQYNDREGMAVALRQLGQIALQEGEIDEAARLLDESQKLYAGTGDLGGQAATLEGQARVALCQGQFAAASAHLLRALHIATRAQLLPLTFAILTRAAELLRQCGELGLARAILSFVQEQPACPNEVKAQARDMLAAGDLAHTTPHSFGTPRDMDEALAALMPHIEATLTHLAAQPAAAQPAPHVHGAPRTQPLIEPLTPRELEVLQLLSAGLSNRQIAAQLVVALGTVKSYTNRIYGKLGVQNRVQAIARAQELAIL